MTTFWRDNLHSRFVAWLKIVLPLAALGILSTVFLISDRFDPSDPVSAADIDLEQRARDEGAANAVLSGVARGGSEVTLRMALARPAEKDPRRLEAEDVSAHVKLGAGRQIEIAARRGTVDKKTGRAILTDEVAFETSDGYALTTERLLLDFDTLRAESPGPVSGTAPAGELTAQRMVLSRDPDTGELHLLFTAGVRLVYKPQVSGE